MFCADHKTSPLNSSPSSALFSLHDYMKHTQFGHAGNWLPSHAPSHKPSYQMLDMTELKMEDKPTASGAYGQVFKGTWLKENVAVAVKKMTRGTDHKKEQTTQSFHNEAEIMANLNHPNVLKLHGAVTDEHGLCLVTEFVPRGSLFDLIHSKSPVNFAPKSVVVIANGICRGMSYLHGLGIIHRDLKPGNLLLGSEMTSAGPQLAVKIADFGHARRLPHTSSLGVLSSCSSCSSLSSRTFSQDSEAEEIAGADEGVVSSGVGTCQYAAPEVLRREAHSEKADVFSFGVVLWEIHTRRIPHGDKTEEEIRADVDVKQERLPQPRHCPEELWRLVLQCWGHAAQARPCFQDILRQLEGMHFGGEKPAQIHAPNPRAVAMRG